MPRKSDYGRFYGKWHPGDAREFRRMLRYQDRSIGAFLPGHAAAPILEIGCGRGIVLSLLKERGYTRISGLETDSKQAEARRADGFDVVFVGDTTAYLRSRPESWDMILALDVLEHVPADRTKDLLLAVFAALSPGGRFAATVPNAASGLAFRWRYNDWTHQMSFTETSLNDLLREAGFKDIRILQAGSLLRPRLPVLVRPSVVRWAALRAVRAYRRLETVAELGWREGRRIPLSLNLLAVAGKPPA